MGFYMHYFVNMSKDDKLVYSYFSLVLYLLENSDEFKKELCSVNFHSDEANTDKELKLAVKQYLLDKLYLPFNDNFSVEFIIDGNVYRTSFSEFKSFSIKNIFLPDNLTTEHKEWIKNNKSGQYVNPDLLIEISNGSTIKYITLELKSTKNDKIPGSSVQQVDPYEWTLFVKHNKNGISLSTGLYANSITNKIPFPDRSPRPEISFAHLIRWNSYNRVFDRDGLRFIISGEEFIAKSQIISDWKKSLVQDWLEYVKGNDKSTRWFDDTLRMFTKEIITYYLALDDIEKKKFLTQNDI